MPPVDEILSLADAQAAVLDRVRPLPAETVTLADAAGRYLARPAKAVVDLPPFRSPAMDGFALRTADTPGRLPVVFRVAPGAPAARALEPGEGMGRATGGVVPDGADAVLQHELVVESDNKIEVSDPVVPGTHIREPGRDVSAGAVVVAPGSR